MADLSEHGRAQLLLVTGFAIAVAIVALVLLLNTAIYTENLATRSVDTGADRALAYRDTVEDNLWPVADDANEDETLDRDERIRTADDRIDRLVDMAGRRHRLAGATVQVTNRTYHNGTRLVQTDGTRELRSDAAGVDWNWTMTAGAEEVRDFELNTTGALRSTNAPAEAFRLGVTGDSGNEWRVYVYNSTVTGNTTIAVTNGTESGHPPSGEAICAEQFRGPPEMNLTAGTVNGTACAGLAFGKGISEPYGEIRVTYGNRTTGTYNVTANTTLTAAVDPNFNDGPPTSPYEVPVVYSLKADVVYRSADLEYRARVSAGPEDDE